MERTTENWFEVQTSRVQENDWNRVSSETYDTPRAARRALRKARETWSGEWETRIIRVTRTEEVWPERHVKPPAGKCSECGHYGASCTGASK